MFTINNNITYSNIESPKIVDESVNGIKYSIKPIAYVGERSGCALVAQYLGTLFNKLGYSAKISYDSINLIYDTALKNDRLSGIQISLFPTLKSILDACVQLNYVKSAELTFFNDIKTLKWYMHEYKNVLVQLKFTDKTQNAYDFEINSTGNDLYSGIYSKGFIVMQYDADSLILQNSLGYNVGAKGFNKISWETFNQLFIDGATFKII